MAHVPGHEEKPTRTDVFRARQKFHLGPDAVGRVLPVGKSEEIQTRAAFGRAFQSIKRRRAAFRETQGLFTTGLNLSRLRALSSIR